MFLYGVVSGHLTSKSDVYSFGVVLLEMLTGRRSMDKNRPNGEHNLVEWARPHLNERRRFFRLIDPRLEGNFSVKGAQKVVQLAHLCLSRDPKSRPLMSEVVTTLKSLVNLKDMASSSYLLQSVQGAPSLKTQTSLPRRLWYFFPCTQLYLDIFIICSKRTKLILFLSLVGFDFRVEGP